MAYVDLHDGQSSQALVHHRFLKLAGYQVFMRQAGPSDAPALLLPHGYPCSSYEFRNFIPALADRWQLFAPDFPGFGYSETPSSFRYDFEGYCDFLEEVVDELELERFVVYLHDYGSQIGLRLAMRRPESIAGLIIQNGDIYEDVLGPKYEGLLEHFARPSEHSRRALIGAVSEEGFREEFLNDLNEAQQALVSPDLWMLHWPLMNTPERRAISIGLMEGLQENLAWFPKYQAYLREHQPPTLIVWGPRDGYMPERSARAYLRDLPKADFHLLDGGHWLLETHLSEVVSLTRSFLERTVSYEARHKPVSHHSTRQPGH